MRCLTVVRAIFVRLLFATHGLMAIWRLIMTTGESRYWLISCALGGLLIETVITLWKKKGKEWKWFCPSVFFYLLCLVPAIWFLELYELDRRIELKDTFNMSHVINNETEELSASIEGIGLEIRIPIRLSSDQWLRTIEQLLLLLLILGRWMLPKGKLTHDQLSQLLLVYIGTAADIVEFFEAFKEEQVMYNYILCVVILSIWSWSLLQFTLVLTASSARKDQSGVSGPRQAEARVACCTPDVYGILISITLQDIPFLVLRLLLIFKYKVVSYTNFFFTCKNALVVMLLMYRLVVVQVEYRKKPKPKKTSYMYATDYTSKTNLFSTGNGMNRKKKPSEQTTPLNSPEEEIPVKFEIKRAYRKPHNALTIGEGSNWSLV